MIITDNAKKIMLAVLQEDKKNVITIEVIKQGCHGQLYLDTIIVFLKIYEEASPCQQGAGHLTDILMMQCDYLTRTFLPPMM